MEPRRILGRAGEDGVVHLDLGVPHVEYEFIVLGGPAPGSGRRPEMTQSEWLAFVDATAGSIADETFRRHGQGGYPERLEF